MKALITVLFVLSTSVVFAGTAGLMSSATVVGTCTAATPVGTAVNVDCSSGSAYAVVMSPAVVPASGVPAAHATTAIITY